MKAIRHSTILTITAVVSATALFTAVTRSLNAGQGGYGPYEHYGYDRGYLPPGPPGYIYQMPGMPNRMQGQGYGYTSRYSAQQPEKSSSSATDALTVSIDGMRFQPAVIRVRAGDQVTWTNNAAMPHTVTGSTDDSLASQRLNNGGLFSHTFEEPGTYTYYCALHPSMTGTVIVE